MSQVDRESIYILIHIWKEITCIFEETDIWVEICRTEVMTVTCGHTATDSFVICKFFSAWDTDPATPTKARLSWKRATDPWMTCNALGLTCSQPVTSACPSRVAMSDGDRDTRASIIYSLIGTGEDGPGLCPSGPSFPPSAVGIWEWVVRYPQPSGVSRKSLVNDARADREAFMPLLFDRAKVFTWEISKMTYNR